MPQQCPDVCRSIHLTNDAVQKKAAHYDAFEDHNKLSLHQLQAALVSEGHRIDVQGSIVPQMRDITAHAFTAAYPAMSGSAVSSCFELMGLDFMIDESGQVRALGLLSFSMQRCCDSPKLPEMAIQCRAIACCMQAAIKAFCSR